MFLFGSKPPAPKIAKQHSADPGFADDLGPNPGEVKSKPIRTSSDPVELRAAINPKGNGGKGGGGSYTTVKKDQYENGFRDSGGFENQSVQELENYAAYKAEETTDTVKNCLRIAEDMKDDASRTMDMLHQQGEQITRTHNTLVDVDQDLSKGEKLLGSLGGMFSKPWKPKKGRPIKGPTLVEDNHGKNKGNLEQREKLGLTSGNQKGNREYAEATSAMEKVQLEKAKQDDGLDDLSDVLSQLKGMATDMGSEIERQNKALDNMNDDVDELNNRMKGANQRGRKLLGK